MKKYMLGSISLLSMMVLASCGSKSSVTSNSPRNENSVLNPQNPVSIKIWHYYNGAQQNALASLIAEFNTTKGKDIGVYVEEVSKGTISDLESAVTAAANGEIGADKMPDIFSSYADTAFSVLKMNKLANLEEYFTKTELDEYLDSYIEEGHFSDTGLYLFPVAKSTEVLMVNKTAFTPFASETGVSYSDLATTEGIVEVAEKYYKWTDEQTPLIPNDGKAFYGRDSLSNYFIIGMQQLGTELFTAQNGEGSIHAEKSKIKKLWENYYVPFVKGYFNAVGTFRSDDVMTGDIIAYTGSSSSSMYFPGKVVSGEEETPIDAEILPISVFEGGKAINVQQGAGMAVSKSDVLHETASTVFLKWFTDKETNLRFTTESAYLPVKKQAQSIDALDTVIAKNNLSVNPKIYSCLSKIMENSTSVTYYTPKSFQNGNKCRRVLDYNLYDKAKADKKVILENIQNGTSYEEAIAPYISDEAFEQWYQSFVTALDDAKNK